MTDDGLHFPSQGLVLKQGRKQYRTPVRSLHWQLRSLISADKHNIVYLPGGHDRNQVLRLNTATCECDPVKLLPFTPRCLVSNGTWLCCGGERGEFVSMNIDATASNDSAAGLGDAGLDLDTEMRLPFGFTTAEADSISGLFAHGQRSTKSFIAKSAKLTTKGDRINGITIWSPSGRVKTHDRAYTFPVAVLANNDRTVKIVGLHSSEDNDKIEPLATIRYPDYVNRAVISPDGNILIAVLDDPYMYVHVRAEDGYSWELKHRIMLKSQKKDDETPMNGTFAACFSPSGAYLAVGTQHGCVSVFDAQDLLEWGGDAVLKTFESSRPWTGHGAIRDMAFCPGPYDLLAWSEDRGRVGLADLRSNCAIRQIVDINNQADFEQINVLDRNTVDPRLLDRRGEQRGSALTSSLGHLFWSDNLRRNESGEDLVDYRNYPLTPSDTEVLESVQNERRRRELARDRAAQARVEPMAARVRDLASTLRYSGGPRHEDPTPREAGTLNPSINRVADLLGNFREQRANVRVRTTGRLYRDVARDSGTSSSNLGQLPPSTQWERPRVERLDPGNSVRGQEPSWMGVLDQVNARQRERGPNDDGPDPVDMLRAIIQQREDNPTRETPDMSVQDGPPCDDHTAGLAWSADGRKFYLAAYNGIYEFKLDLLGRMLSPSICLR